MLSGASSSLFDASGGAAGGLTGWSGSGPGGKGSTHSDSLSALLITDHFQRDMLSAIAEKISGCDALRSVVSPRSSFRLYSAAAQLAFVQECDWFTNFQSP